MALAVVRSVESARSSRSRIDAEEFEQELIDQYSLALSAAGLTDGTAAAERGAIFDFTRFLGRPLWTAQVEDADRYLRAARTQRGLAKSTVAARAGTLAKFYDFVIVRYQGDIHALFGQVVVQPIDEFNRPRAIAAATATRVPRGQTRSVPCSTGGAMRCPTAGSTFQRPGTIWPRPCGDGSVCGSTRRSCWTSPIGIPSLVPTASCTSATARAAGAEAPKYESCQQSTTSTHCWSGG